MKIPPPIRCLDLGGDQQGKSGRKHATVFIRWRGTEQSGPGVVRGGGEETFITDIAPSERRRRRFLSETTGKKGAATRGNKSVWKKIFFLPCTTVLHPFLLLLCGVSHTHTHTPLRDRKLELPQPFPPPPPIPSGRRVREGRKTEARDQRGNLESPTPSPPKIFPHKTLLLLLPLCSRLHPLSLMLVSDNLRRGCVARFLER